MSILSPLSAPTVLCCSCLVLVRIFMHLRMHSCVSTICVCRVVAHLLKYSKAESPPLATLDEARYPQWRLWANTQNGVGAILESGLSVSSQATSRNAGARGSAALSTCLPAGGLPHRRRGRNVALRPPQFRDHPGQSWSFPGNLCRFRANFGRRSTASVCFRPSFR